MMRWSQCGTASASSIAPRPHQTGSLLNNVLRTTYYVLRTTYYVLLTYCFESLRSQKYFPSCVSGLKVTLKPHHLIASQPHSPSWSPWTTPHAGWGCGATCSASHLSGPDLKIVGKSQSVQNSGPGTYVAEAVAHFFTAPRSLRR
eukprot:COSAG01_NODE_4187_length_5258_cov_294.487691_3_plen_145_part_00